ncbi:hypothetical protein HGA92_03055, partial [Candidatus Gracilibacteria bacterium]|nr:hypothetical protein [Candidatus Gracilibacteria bacterium]
MEKIAETKICKQCNTSFDITDKDLEFYERVSPIFPNPGVSFSIPGLKQVFPPREKGVKENIPLNGGGTKEAVSQRPVSFHETGLNSDSQGSGLKDLGNGKIKYLIPSPTLCPQCREQRRTSFRNERKLYKRKCDFSGKDIISIYSPDKPYKVYDQNIWWSDTWGDGLDYACDFDFSTSFFEQFDKLMKKSPLYSLLNSNTENSNFSNYIHSAKNCYMSYVVYYDPENIYYSNQIYGGKNIIDCFGTYYSQNCYECINSNDCYNCYYGNTLHGCKNCYYCRNLEGCDNCIGCANLKNKKYHIFNSPVSKEEFEHIKKQANNKDFIHKCFSFIYSQIYKCNQNIHCENCSGDYLKDCKNVFDAYDIYGSEDSKFILAEESKNCYDGRGGNLEYCYEFTRVGWGRNNLFSMDLVESSNIIYSFQIYYSNNCFGCVGLKNKSYCILNKQYTKEEYEALVPKIIEHMMTPPKSPSIEGESGAIVKQGEQEWGEFFPSSLSPFGYNETVAQEYFPINTPPIPHPIPQKEKGNNSCLFSFSLGGKDAGKADRGTFNW